MSNACAGSSADGILGLRVGGLFIILVTSLVGTLFPVIAKRVPFLRRRVPGSVFEFAKFFGSAADQLGGRSIRSAGGCIDDTWADFPYASAFCMSALFAAFVLQMVAFRLGSAKLAKMGKTQPDQPTQCFPARPSSLDSVVPTPRDTISGGDELELSRNPSLVADKAPLPGETRPTLREHAFHDASEENPLLAQAIAIGTLEFGICFHSVIIGLTLAVTQSSEFRPLLVVIVFHQAFEGLGVGTRLAFLDTKPGYEWIPWVGSLIYSICTPIGMAVGLGLEQGLAITGESATLASGIMNSLSAGILLYTALVELMAHEFVFNRFYHTCGWGSFSFAIVSFAVGAGLMGLIGKWA
ncbi:hypothetical protein Rhopal_001655-T1 [Rhodotorula paludigena]|uniref:Uncharacterized protein n=1 Tax=Rhodotorula paludigena TaxID=86838 RepID=A0AAV5GDU2_9BASI|nr:hypothetical protein Rhopal_001655-T1 [Rhodotorula paludigena]